MEPRQRNESVDALGDIRQRSGPIDVDQEAITKLLLLKVPNQG